MFEDIPIFINLNNIRNSLTILENLSDIENFYPAWDQVYSSEMIKQKIFDARKIIDELEIIACDADEDIDLHLLVNQACDTLHMPMLKDNLLFAKTLECCMRNR